MGSCTGGIIGIPCVSCIAPGVAGNGNTAVDDCKLHIFHIEVVDFVFVVGNRDVDFIANLAAVQDLEGQNQDIAVSSEVTGKQSAVPLGFEGICIQCGEAAIRQELCILITHQLQLGVVIADVQVSGNDAGVVIDGDDHLHLGTSLAGSGFYLEVRCALVGDGLDLDDLAQNRVVPFSLFGHILGLYIVSGISIQVGKDIAFLPLAPSDLVFGNGTSLQQTYGVLQSADSVHNLGIRVHSGSLRNRNGNGIKAYFHIFGFCCGRCLQCRCLGLDGDGVGRSGIQPQVMYSLVHCLDFVIGVALQTGKGQAFLPCAPGFSASLADAVLHHSGGILRRSGRGGNGDGRIGLFALIGQSGNIQCYGSVGGFQHDFLLYSGGIAVQGGITNDEGILGILSQTGIGSGMIQSITFNRLIVLTATGVEEIRAAVIGLIPFDLVNGIFTILIGKGNVIVVDHIGDVCVCRIGVIGRQDHDITGYNRGNSVAFSDIQTQTGGVLHNGGHGSGIHRGIHRLILGFHSGTYSHAQQIQDIHGRNITAQTAFQHDVTGRNQIYFGAGCKTHEMTGGQGAGQHTGVNIDSTGPSLLVVAIITHQLAAAVGKHGHIFQVDYTGIGIGEGHYLVLLVARGQLAGTGDHTDVQIPDGNCGTIGYTDEAVVTGFVEIVFTAVGAGQQQIGAYRQILAEELAGKIINQNICLEVDDVQLAVGLNSLQCLHQSVLIGNFGNHTVCTGGGDLDHIGYTFGIAIELPVIGQGLALNIVGFHRQQLFNGVLPCAPVFSIQRNAIHHGVLFRLHALDRGSGNIGVEAGSACADGRYRQGRAGSCIVFNILEGCFCCSQKVIVGDQCSGSFAQGIVSLTGSGNCCAAFRIDATNGIDQFHGLQRAGILSRRHIRHSPCKRLPCLSMLLISLAPSVAQDHFIAIRYCVGQLGGLLRFIFTVLIVGEHPFTGAEIGAVCQLVAAVFCRCKNLQLIEIITGHLVSKAGIGQCLVKQLLHCGAVSYLVGGGFQPVLILCSTVIVF